MKRSERMQRLNSLNIDQRDQASRKLGLLIAEHGRQLERLEKLQSYHLDYQQQLRAKQPTSNSARELDQFRRFLASLRLAISQQEQQVAAAEHQVGLGQLDWQSRQSEVRKLELLCEKLILGEGKRSQRTEQQQVDEANLRNYWRDSSNAT
jgi:flagellar export protein FliJ